MMSTPWLDIWLQTSLGLDHTPGPDELRAVQMQLVRRTLAHAASQSPFYRERLTGIAAEALRSMADLARLPRTIPDDLRERPDAFLAVSQDEIARVISVPSSGTSGPGKRVFYTPGDLERITRFFGYGMRNLLEHGETALVLLPGERPDSVGALLSKALETFGAQAVALGPEQAFSGPLGRPDRALEILRNQDIRCIVGAPAHLNVLAAHWAAQGGCRKRLRSVLLCWDSVPSSLARNVEQAFGCRALQHWGMVETGLGGAVSCGRSSGLHLREADILVEIADPDSGAQLPDGEWGEILVTTLSRRAMPLIRYATGDRGRILPETCACGSPLRRLDARVRRLQGDLPLPGGKHLGAIQLGERLYALPGLLDFRARLEPAPSHDPENLKNVENPENVENMDTANTAPETLLVEINHLTPEDVAQGADLCDAARNALASLAVQTGSDAPLLRIEVRDAERCGPALPGLEKRILLRRQDPGGR